MKAHDTELLDFCQDFSDLEGIDDDNIVFKEFNINHIDDFKDQIDIADNKESNALHDMIETSVMALVSDAIEAVKYGKQNMAGMILVHVFPSEDLSQIMVDTLSSIGGIAQRQGCDAVVGNDGEVKIL